MDEQPAGAPLQPQVAPQQSQSSMAQATMPLPSATQLLSSAWKEYKAHMGLLVSIFLVPLIVGLVVSFLQESQDSNAVPGAVVLVLALVNMVVSLLGQIAIFTAVSNIDHATFTSSYATGYRQFFPYLLFAIISIVIVGGLSLLFIVPGVSLAVLLMTKFALSLGFAAIFLASAIVFVFCIPALIFSIWFSMSVLTFIVDGERGVEALLKSKAYVDGHWWEVFSRLVFIGIVMVILIIAVPSIIGGLLYVAGVGAMISIYLIGLVSALLSLVLTPLSYVYLFHLYQGLKAGNAAVAMNRSSGHKAKFIVPAIIGLALVPLFIGGLIFYGASQGITLPGAEFFQQLQNSDAALPQNSEESAFPALGEEPLPSDGADGAFVDSASVLPPAPAQ